MEKSSVASESVDVITICNVLHRPDMDAAVKEMHQQLKKGGTLCIPVYGWPRMLDPEFSEVERLWLQIWKGGVAHLLKGKAGQRTGKNLSRGMQNVGFPEYMWESGVQRIVFNTDGDILNISTPIWEMSEREPSRVGKYDIQEWRERDFKWTIELNCGQIKAFYYSMSPRDKERDIGKFERVIGGMERKVTLYCPATQLIATKR